MFFSIHYCCCYCLYMIACLGAIELAVFSELFSMEVDVVDIQTNRIDKFGEPGFSTAHSVFFFSCLFM